MTALGSGDHSSAICRPFDSHYMNSTIFGITPSTTNTTFAQISDSLGCRTSWSRTGGLEKNPIKGRCGPYLVNVELCQIDINLEPCQPPIEMTKTTINTGPGVRKGKVLRSGVSLVVIRVCRPVRSRRGDSLFDNCSCKDQAGDNTPTLAFIQ